MFVVTDRLGSGFSARDAGRAALRLQGFPEPVRAIALNAEQPLVLPDYPAELPHRWAIAELSGRPEQADRLSVRIGTASSSVSIPPLVHPMTRPKPPFLTRLEVVRRAWR